ncbi:flavocytochrome c [Serpentinicella alkaliphila]|uniref:Urocanate reductase n=1 Tax=Serpentinicella alkaliphila TaxID=1734049 RepID=A0A4R2TEV8_9FIRM|nr:flavocytochrome c [Serpentinicella alkaliphila]QUH25526.1 flavocytochrome c [Serpentinicella alkaliphila]TCQ01878.1 fumarate reductase flavoprotein subunit [Serpentinicella alkaliphila]
MKREIKLMSILITILLIISLAACSNQNTNSANTSSPKMKAGEYIVEVNGFKPMKVKVTLSDTSIKAVEVVSHSETPNVSDVALKEIPKNIIEKQSIGIDTISGATMTSSAIISAVTLAIEKAGGQSSEFNIKNVADGSDSINSRPPMGTKDLPQTWDLTYDVVVVGGGFAGLAAAYETSTLGAETLLIDKMPVLGGNSQINGGVYASYTSKIADELYKKLNLTPDSAQKHIEDTIKGGDYMNDTKLVKNLVYGAPYFLNLMLDNGLEVRESITRPGGHYGYRTYTTKNGIGADIVAVQKKILADTSTTVMLNTEMVQIYRETTGEQRVIGIKVKTKDGLMSVKANKGVILATGGFGGNVEMRSKHVPGLTADIPTTNHVGATGEGIIMAQEIGANTTQMSYIQLYPFADPNNGVLDATAVIPFSGPSSGIVYVDVNGKRYVNEGERRDVCSRAAQESGGFPTFSIFGQEIVEKGGFISETQLSSGIESDRIFKASTLEELVSIINTHQYKGQSISMSAQTLVSTIKNHNSYVEAGKDPEFNKKIDKGVMLKIDKGPYYAIPQWPSVHHTMGGLTINERTEVQDIWGEIIPGFYAAGEVVGGVHGTNRLGSNAIPDAAVHGIIAGRVAVNGTVPDFIPKE